MRCVVPAYAERLVDSCIVELDRRALQGALSSHVARTGQADSKRPNKVRPATDSFTIRGQPLNDDICSFEQNLRATHPVRLSMAWSFSVEL